jgi:hypothetical protein
MDKYNFIVGDCFSSFSLRPGVIKWSEFKEIKPSEIDEYRKNGKYIIGQGIDNDEVNILKNQNLELYSLLENQYVFDKNLKMAHKHKLQNCHINIPREISSDEYDMDVQIDSRCCELDDHITGEHINGIIIIEAARQAFIAVTEKFYLNENDSFYFVLSNMSCTFTRFLFPLPIKIKHQVLWYERHSKKGEEQIDFKVQTEFFQTQEKSACLITGDFSLYQKELMIGVEKKKADESIKLFKDS